MTKQEIAAFAAKLLGDEPDAEKLAFAVELTLGETAEEYVPPIREEVLLTEEGKLRFSDFSLFPVHILEVRQGGRSVPYRTADYGIKTEPGRVTVRYAYALSDLPADGAFELPVSVRALAFGAAGEYCLLTMRFQEAEMFNRRYQESMRTFCRKQSPMTLPTRRWV